MQIPQTKPNSVAIYFLVDPRSPDKIRYVGQSMTPRIRHLQHCAESATSAKGEWIESLRQIARPGESGLLTNSSLVPKPKPAPDAKPKPKPKADPKPVEIQVQQSEDSPLPLLAAAERDAIVQMLKTTNNNKLEASKRLGIGRQTLYNKIALYGIKVTKT